MATPSLEEIRDAVFGASSSSGLDGFGGYFFQKCWDIISDDVSAVIIHLFASLNIPVGMNSSFVALILTVANFIRVTDFPPIVMGNFMYKIFTKIVATRLSSFIGDILSPS